MSDRKSGRRQDATGPPERRQPSAANRQNVSVGKAATLLRAAAGHPDGASVSELARAARIPRATALRMITALEAEGLLLRLDRRDLVLLGTAVLDLAAAVRPELILTEAAREPLTGLARATGETVTLAVRHGDRIIGIDEIRSPHVIGPTTWVGRSWPLEGTASGRLALGTVAATAVAESVDEIEIGLASLAAAIETGSAADAYITVSGPTYRFGAAEREAAAQPLLAAAGAVARRLTSPPDG